MGWDDNGLPTERRVQNYYGVRCDPSQPYDASYEPPADAGDAQEGHAAGQHQPAQLRRAVPRAVGRGREGLRGPVQAARAVGRLDADLRDDRRPRPAGRPAGVPAQPGPRRGVRHRGADALGRRLQDRRGAGRARRPRAARRLPPDRLRHAGRRAGVHRDDPPRADPGLRGAGGPPRRRALPAAVRHDGDDAAVRRRGAGARPRAGRPGQGLGHRDDLHLRRHHRRHLVARARPAGAQHRRPRRPDRADAARRRGAGALRRAGRQDREAGAEAHRRAARRLRRPRRRAQGDHPPGEVLRDAATARSRSSRAGSGTCATAAATPTCAPTSSPAARSSPGTPASCRAATRTG